MKIVLENQPFKVSGGCPANNETFIQEILLLSKSLLLSHEYLLLFLAPAPGFRWLLPTGCFFLFLSFQRLKHLPLKIKP
jgi:hypothetical protein